MGIIINFTKGVKKMHFLNCIITYQKSNGDIFIRPYDYNLSRKVGDETSMGWKIIDIHYKHNDNYYCYEDIMRIFREELEAEIKDNKKKEKEKKLIKFLIEKLNGLI